MKSTNYLILGIIIGVIGILISNLNPVVGAVIAGIGIISCIYALFKLDKK